MKSWEEGSILGRTIGVIETNVGSSRLPGRLLAALGGLLLLDRLLDTRDETEENKRADLHSVITDVNQHVEGGGRTAW